jgi:hypothetical protein
MVGDFQGLAALLFPLENFPLSVAIEYYFMPLKGDIPTRLRRTGVETPEEVAHGVTSDQSPDRLLLSHPF